MNIKVKFCELCGQHYIGGREECPHCADARRYIDATGMIGVGRQKLRDGLRAILIEMEQDAGHQIPPLFAAVIYRLYHMDIKPGINIAEMEDESDIPEGFRKCPICKMAIPEDDFECGHCREAREYLDYHGLNIAEIKPVLLQIEQDIYGQLTCAIPPKYVLMIYRRYHMSKGDA